MVLSLTDSGDISNRNGGGSGTTPGESKTLFIASSNELGGTKSSSSVEAIGGPNKDAMFSGRKPTLGNRDDVGNGGRSRGKLNIDSVGELTFKMLVGRFGLGQDTDGEDNESFVIKDLPKVISSVESRNWTRLALR